MAKTTVIRFLFAKGSTDFGGYSADCDNHQFLCSGLSSHILQKVESGGGMNYEVFKDQLTSKEIAELKEFVVTSR